MTTTSTRPEMDLPIEGGGDPRATLSSKSRTPRDRPMVLIGEQHEWLARSLASVIAPRGYDVFHAFSVQEILREAPLRMPDLIVLGSRLPGKQCVEVCRELRQMSNSGPVTPIVVLTSVQVAQDERLALLEAGAWDCIPFPEQVPELLAKARTFARAKISAEEGLREGLLDQETGLYNLRGLLRRARDESAEAWRYSTPLACVALAPDLASEERLAAHPEREAKVIGKISEVLRSEMRNSDVLARLGRLEFGVLAPSTDGVGAAVFARRLLDSFDLELEKNPPFQNRRTAFQAGCFGVNDTRKEGLDAEKLVRRAQSALQKARADGPTRRIEPSGAA